MQILVREAEHKDVPAIMNIYRSAGIGGDDNFRPDEACQHLSELVKNQAFRIFVAVTSMQCVGTYELLIMENLAKRGRRSGIVEDVAVHPAFQRQGIGRAMMLHAAEECRRKRCYKLTLSSNLSRGDAHKFYKASGFRIHGYSLKLDV